MNRRAWWLRAFCLALIVRLLFLLLLSLQAGGRFREPDSQDYVSLATNLRQHASFARDAAGAVPDLKRGPAYPVFLMLCALPCDRPGIALLSQAFFSALSAAALVFALRSSGHSFQSCRSAGLLLAFEPLSVSYAALLLSDSLFASALTLWLAAWLVLRREPASSGWRLLLDLMAALAVLLRPPGLLLLPLNLWLAWRQPRRGRSLTLFAVIALSPVLLWMGRNAWHSGSWTLSTIAATNALEYRAAGVLAAERGEPYLKVRAELRARFGDDDPARSPQDQVLRARAEQAEALRILRAAPLRALSQSLRGFAVVLASPGCAPALRSLGWYPGGSGLYSALSSASLRDVAEALGRLFTEGWALVLGLVLGYSYLGLLGFALWGGRERIAEGWLLAVVALILMLAAAGPEAEPRFRLPAMAFLIVLATPGLPGESRHRAAASQKK